LPKNEISKALQDDVSNQIHSLIESSKKERSLYIQENQLSQSSNILNNNKKRAREEHSNLQEEVKSSEKKKNIII
jgi:hypothetical protein